MQQPSEFYSLVKGRAVAMSVALEQRDAPTSQHCQRVARLAVSLGRRWGLPVRDLRLLEIAAAFHDVGKIGIPDDVLKKPSTFTDDDWAIMKTHAERGQRILHAAGLRDGETLGLAIRHHHERYDGHGYPDGLAGEEIPLLARIIAIADTYDAMATPRIYGRWRPPAEIVAVLEAEQGRQHDPYLSEMFLEMIGVHRFTVPARASA
jgi:HD-GYP domain-containing protein (c-di-GMP phosphodiesterase class II)